jgi:hypothetical protein
MTKRGFLDLDWRGEGVAGPGLELGLGLGLHLGFLGTESGRRRRRFGEERSNLALRIDEWRSATALAPCRCH